MKALSACFRVSDIGENDVARRKNPGVQKLKRFVYLNHRLLMKVTICFFKKK